MRKRSSGSSFSIHSPFPYLFLVLLAFSGAPGCFWDKAEETVRPPGDLRLSPPSPTPQDKLAAQGRINYQGNCIACHNSDPGKPGSIGPEIQGASLELLEARILRAEYPPGYTPKRATHAMPALPQARALIPSLHAFLNSGH